MKKEKTREHERMERIVGRAGRHILRDDVLQVEPILPRFEHVEL
jgi:hypothetical protein